LKSRFANGFVAVFQIEVLFNLKRVAPYALMCIFSANALLWWARGPAVTRGWAVNSDFYIVWLFGGFSFMTMPLFIALMMGDPVIRDFRIGVDPLIFSKPVSRLQYLLGKFCGNFFVLVCCQARFALTPMLLQAFSTKGMLVLSPRLVPYLQHFFFFVVVTSLALAAICFTVGTLTRSVKIVYALTLSSYFLYIAWQETMKGWPERWRVALDPLLFNVGAESWRGRSAEWLNQLSVGYDVYMIANRVAMIALALLCLAILYARFSIAERGGADASQNQTSILDLAPSGAERLYHERETTGAARVAKAPEALPRKQVALPQVEIVTQGWRAALEQFLAALCVEFRLLRAERSLIVVAPLITLMCGLELAVYKVVPQLSYSASYASRTENTLLLFLFGIAVFYTGEAMHRDRELRIEPLLWSVPAPNAVLLLSKFAATLLLSLALILPVALTAIGVQLYKGDAPLELSIYLKTYALILIPSTLFMCAASVAANVLLRDKYLAYAASLAHGGATYYLMGQGYHNWLYNPVLYRLWTPADLMSGGGQLTRILFHRIYCLALSVLLLALALLFFRRKSNRRLRAQGRLSDKGWTLLIAAVSVLIAVIAGFIVSQTAPVAVILNMRGIG
jgi:ABC-type transport system involved in multi-copper enzyme maturation permease subunit